jgi:carboxypeptidase family protein
MIQAEAAERMPRRSAWRCWRRIERTLVRVVCGLGVLAGGPSRVRAGEPATVGCLEGTVTGLGGVDLAGPSVVARNTATGVALEQWADQLGHFAFPNLPPGAYEVTVDEPGFKEARVEATVQEGRPTSLRATLSLDAVDPAATLKLPGSFTDGVPGSIRAMVGGPRGLDAALVAPTLDRLEPPGMDSVMAKGAVFTAATDGAAISMPGSGTGLGDVPHLRTVFFALDNPWTLPSDPLAALDGAAGEVSSGDLPFALSAPGGASPGHEQAGRGAGELPVELVVEAGRPLHVAFAEEVKLVGVGQRVTGTLVEPLYSFDRMVVPAGARVRGHVEKLVAVTGWPRVRAILHGDLTPLHRAILQFDTLVLVDCREIPISTRVGEGSRSVSFVVAGASKKTGLVARAEEELARKVAQAEAPLKEPGKMERLKEDLVARLPYHPQYLRRGTVYTAELLAPLRFGTVWPTPRAPEGTPPPADGILNARLETPLDSRTTPRGTQVRAVVTQPVFSADERLILPAGAELVGEVTLAKEARWLHRNGQLRFLFETVRLPEHQPSKLLASLYSARLSRDDSLAIDDEGGASVESPKTRFIAPALSLLAVRSTMDFDADYGRGLGLGNPAAGVHRGHVRGSALAGFFGMNILGVALSQVSAPVSVALGVVGAARNVYGSVIGRGREVVIPADTPLQLQLAANPAQP